LEQATDPIAEQSSKVSTSPLSVSEGGRERERESIINRRSERSLA
jgi:hypothetical protein